MISYTEGYHSLSLDGWNALLEKIDTAFDPPLSSGTELSQYAFKIFNYANTILAYKEENLAGFCAFYDNRPAEAFLTLIYVDPAFRNEHIGRTFMKRMEEIATEKNIQQLSLEVEISNQTATRFYESMGFMANGIINNKLIMKKEMTAKNKD